MSDSLWPHGLQHARPPCPSQTPGVYSNSCPLSQWCHPTISSSVIPFSSCPQSFPASGSFQMSQFFTLGGQSTGVSSSTSVLPMNIWDWFSLGWLVGSPCSPRDSQEFSPTAQFKSINSSALSFLYSPTLTSIHDYWKTSRSVKISFPRNEHWTELLRPNSPFWIWEWAGELKPLFFSFLFFFFCSFKGSKGTCNDT